MAAVISKSAGELRGASVAPELLARVKQLQIRTHRLVNTALAGGYRSIYRGQGIEFEEVRPYQPGDEVRAIDWNVTARAGEPYVKAYREERELSIHLLVDTALSMDFGTQTWTKREAAAQLAGLLAHVAIRNQDRVGLTLFGPETIEHLPPSKSSRHIMRLIHEVMLAPVSDQRTDFAHVFEATANVLHRRSLILVVSDFLGQEDGGAWLEPLRRLGRRHDVIVAPVTDPLEMRLPAAGPIWFRSSQSGGLREVDGRSASVRKAWAQDAEQRRASLNTQLKRAQVDRLPIDVGEDLAGPLMAFFRRRALRLGRGLA